LGVRDDESGRTSAWHRVVDSRAVNKTFKEQIDPPVGNRLLVEFANVYCRNENESVTMATVYIVFALVLLVAVLLLIFVIWRSSDERHERPNLNKSSEDNPAHDTIPASKRADLPPLEYPRGEPGAQKRG
jgi:hypothetical protein